MKNHKMILNFFIIVSAFFILFLGLQGCVQPDSYPTEETSQTLLEKLPMRTSSVSYKVKWNVPSYYYLPYGYNLYAPTRGFYSKLYKSTDNGSSYSYVGRYDGSGSATNKDYSQIIIEYIQGSDGLPLAVELADGDEITDPASADMNGYIFYGYFLVDSSANQGAGIENIR